MDGKRRPSGRKDIRRSAARAHGRTLEFVKTAPGSIQTGERSMSRDSKPVHSDTNPIEVRHCESLAEFEQCVELQRVIWGERITVPAAIFVVAQHTGGHILGAFDAGTLIGFTLALAGDRGGKPFLHSHMTGVLPEYQNRNIGRRLKLS